MGQKARVEKKEMEEKKTKEEEWDGGSSVAMEDVCVPSLWLDVSIRRPVP
jgi:hypothetical protein